MKKGDAIFLEPEMPWSSLDHFLKVLIKIGKNESLMTLLLVSKQLRAVEFLGNFSSCLVDTMIESCH